MTQLVFTAGLFMGINYDDILKAKDVVYRDRHRFVESIWIPESLRRGFLDSLELSHDYKGHVGSLAGVPVFFFVYYTEYLLWEDAFYIKHKRKPTVVIMQDSGT